jgi:hypothetical protein
MRWRCGLRRGQPRHARPDGGPPGLAVAPWVATGALWLSSMALTPFGPGMGVGVFASLIAQGTVVHAVPTAALHERGVAATCTVPDVETRTTTSSHHVSNGSDGGYRTGGTTTRYVHTLRCGSPGRALVRPPVWGSERSPHHRPRTGGTGRALGSPGCAWTPWRPTATTSPW